MSAKSRAFAYLPVLVAAFSLAVAGYYLDKSYQYSNRIDLRVKAASAVSFRADNLQRRIDYELSHARDIRDALSQNPEMTADEFDGLASTMLADNADLLQISAIRQNETFFGKTQAGVPYSKPPAFHSDEDRTVNQWEETNASNEPRFSHVFLVSPGHYGFYAIMPVFTRQNGNVVRWGFVSAVFDAHKLLTKAGIAYSGNGQFHYVVQEEGGPKSAFKPFFRVDQVDTLMRMEPVIATADALDAQWHVAAVPYGGWDRAPAHQILLRVGFTLFSLLILVPFFLSARLRLERNKSIAALGARERALETLSRRFDFALQSHRCGVWDAAMNVEDTHWDERMMELHGIAGRHGWATRRNWLSLVHPDERTAAHEALLRATETRSKFSVQCRVVHPDGTLRHLRYVGQFHADTDGRPRLYGIAFDVTEDVALTEALVSAKTESESRNAKLETALIELSQREGELKETSQRLSLAAEAYECGIWDADLDKGETIWDRRMHDFFGVPYVNGITLADTWENAIHPDDREVTIQATGRAINEGVRFAQTYRVFTPDGALRHIHAVGQTHRNAAGVNKFIGIAVDVTEDVTNNEALMAAKNEAEARRAELEAAHLRIQHNATHDPLTGLANRRALDEMLDRLAQEKRSPEQRVTLLHIDLDRFKQINDTLGHAAGDAMLAHAAQVLTQNTRSNDLVARIGGDEFVILIQNNATNREIAAIARRIIDRMNQPVPYEGHECRFGVSIGIAREQRQKNSVKKLLVNADIALYRAKDHGRNGYEFFTASLQAEIRRTKKLADDILRGIENEEFQAWYQPQFCAKTHDLSGVEALVRWNHPEHGWMAPDAFLKVAEEINAVATLDRLVLERAMTDRLRWASAGLIVPKISVNVSARRLRDDLLVKSLKDLSITPGQIAFELVESIYLDDDDDVVTRNIKRIKALGIDIEIDDFGTGHTSIVSLLKLEPKRLKIDRQLVAPMLTSAREHSLVRSILEIGASLDIETVAEGVESMAHAARLKELGCDVLQGYAFAKPMPAESLPDFVSARPWAAETFRKSA